VVAALLYSQASYPFGRRGGPVLLSGEARLERTLCATVEVGRAPEYFGSLDMWTRSIRSFAVLIDSFLSVW
jgi:hypothetical protein